MENVSVERRYCLNIGKPTIEFNELRLLGNAKCPEQIDTPNDFGYYTIDTLLTYTIYLLMRTPWRHRM